jgi:hypothetical protein
MLGTISSRIDGIDRRPMRENECLEVITSLDGYMKFGLVNDHVILSQRGQLFQEMA